MITPESLAAANTEHAHQCALFCWAAISIYPELQLMFAIPNGGLRHKGTAVRLKAEGAKAGMLDIMLPVARKGCHGLFVELKRPAILAPSIKTGKLIISQPKGKTSNKQDSWIDKLREQGYGACSCEGWIAARDVLVQYLGE